jgi:hypothetical protein
MGVGSLLLAALSAVFIGLSVVTTLWAPAAAAVFSFCAPALALAGLIAGGMAMSRAKREKRSGDVGLAGAIVSGLCFVPALLTALTCGVCNALWSDGQWQAQRNFNFQLGKPQSPDPNQPAPPEPPPFPAQPGQPEPEPAPPAAPPGLPPPPLPPSPGQP